jgi:hypothetical protein
MESDGTSAGNSNKRRWTTGKHGNTKLHYSRWNASIHQSSTHINRNEQSNLNNHYRTNGDHNHINPNHNSDFELTNQPVPPIVHDNPGSSTGSHTIRAEKLAQEN